MKKRTLSFLLALVMCLSLLPMTALAAYTPDPAKFDAPIISDLAVSEPDENGEAMLTFVLKNPDSIKNALAHYNENSDGAIWDINGQVSIDGGEWQKISITNGSDFAEGARETIRIKELHVDSQIKFRTYYTGWDVNGYYSGWYGDEMGKYSNVLTLNEKVDFEASDWAQTYIQQADQLGLIPEVLEGADLSKPINRLEFAAVCVKVYENLGNTTALPAVNNPFTDTNDIEVLKAYNAGITAGTSPTTFSPDNLLNRQEMATMLTAVYKRVFVANWQAGVDYNHLLGYEDYMASNPFADHDHIDTWARPSVYFMAKYGVVSGMGGNNFGPKNVTTAQQAQGYANATREQALTIAVAMVKNFGK